MTKKLGYIPKEERKNILLLCDDIRMHSGIATMAREFVIGTAHHFNWYNVGAAITHPDAGKVFDLSQDVNKTVGLEDADVKVMPNNGYGDAQLIRKLTKQMNFDAVFIFTDPRYWIWLFDIEREIRSKMPIMWLNIWDDYPAPMYNKTYYNSVDVLMAISKQTKNINELVLGEEAKNKLIKYVPHGINEKHFFPIESSDPTLIDFKKNLFGEKEINFVVFWNSRNIHRKHPADLILAYKLFCDSIGQEEAKKCALVMHTSAVDQNGTDLKAVKDALCDPEYVNVFFSQAKIPHQQMNMLYNVADVTALVSSNEGWGLSLTESMMAGTMIIGNVSGGMQDQMRFEDEKGNWIDFSSDFPSNHRGTIKQCGDWAIPVFPSNISLAGSPATPYIFDDRCAPEDVSQAIWKVYRLDAKTRKENGLKGREWATSDESQMSAKTMCSNIINVMDEGFSTFKPRPNIELIKIGERPSKKVTHKISGY